jgi:hypothetical protein
MEILIPIILISVIAGLRAAISRTDQPDQLNLEDKWTYDFNDSQWPDQLIIDNTKVAFVPDNSISKFPYHITSHISSH